MKLKLFTDKVFLFLIIIIIIGGYVKPMLKPVEIVNQENRNANKFPTLSISKYNDKTFQDDYEKAYADQIPLANKMKIWSKNFSAFTKITYYKIFGKGFYNNLDGRIQMIDDYLVYKQRNLEELKKVFDLRIKNINEIAKKNKNIPIYVYYIERDSDVNFETNEKNGAYEYLVSNLDNNIKYSKFEINSLADYENYFYKTDHHWNYKGAQKAYKEIVDMIYKDKKLKLMEPNEELCMNTNFEGSKTRTLGATKVFKEPFCAYIYTFKKHDIYVNGKKVDYYGKYNMLMKQNPKSITYATWYGGDAGLLLYDYNDSTKENLLILGDSFDNAINELLASEFNKTFIVDLRNYKRENGKTFKLNTFVNDNNINRILFIGSNGFYNEVEFIVEGVE